MSDEEKSIKHYQKRVELREQLQDQIHELDRELSGGIGKCVVNDLSVSCDVSPRGIEFEIKLGPRVVKTLSTREMRTIMTWLVSIGLEPLGPRDTAGEAPEGAEAPAAPGMKLPQDAP